MKPKTTPGLNADLENFELTDVMQLITQQVKCGVLSVEGEDGRCAWFFTDGSLVNFDCSFPKHLLGLRDLLNASGQHTGKRSGSLPENSDQEINLAWEMVKSSRLTPTELNRINLRRLIESFIITLQWKKGAYKFVPTSEVRKNPFLDPQDTNFIILEALRQIDELAVMKKRLEPLKRVFTTTLAASHEDIQNQPLFEKSLEDQFDPDQLEIYQLFDGKRNLEEILTHNSIGQFHACGIILDFFERGIIGPGSDQPDNLQAPEKAALWHYFSPGNLSLIILLLAIIFSVSFNSYKYLTGTGDQVSFSRLISVLQSSYQQQGKTGQ